MAYNRFERHLAALLDSAPGLRAWARSGYRRANYFLHAWRAGPPRVHPLANLRRIAGGAGHGSVEESFFGYFGLQPWSRDGRRHLLHRRLRGRAAVVEISVHDERAGTTTVLGESRAWNYQQGAMAQWLVHEGVESVVFNDVVGRRLVSRIVGAAGRETTLDWPIQALRPGAPEALSLNYRRLALLRPEYGYRDDVDNFAPDQPLDSDGLWRFDLRTGRADLCVSLRELADAAPAATGEDRHKVNHAVYSPDGSRFVFMHRWLGPRGKFSRLYAANADGTGLRLLLDHRMVSHYAWRDETTLLAYARAPEQGDRYYLIDVPTGSRRAFGAGTLDRFGDGHPSYSPDRLWLVTDTYPDRARMSRLLLCNVGNGRVTEVGAFHSPWRFDGPVRCDLHPRWNRDGTEISIDSVHEGRRGVYAVDVSRLLAERP
jgi:hypothetical protein